MGKKVICYIQAFDCEETIAAAMESVLHQTYEDWLCFVLSNGNKSTEQLQNHSLDVIKAIALKDKRFIVINKKNNNVDMYIPMLYHLAGLFPDSYICSLDADDVYKQDFFERAVTLGNKKQLDIICSGTEIVLKKNVESTEEKVISKREIEGDVIFEKKDFGIYFPKYKPFFNEMWGKLYNARLFGKEFNREYAKKHFFKRFLPDTLFTVDNLSRAKAIGILSGTSHKFYQYEQRKASNATLLSNASVANRREIWCKSRFSVYYTYNELWKFIASHNGMNAEGYEYMQAVLFGWFGDFYSRTLVMTQDEKKLAEHVYKLVFNPKFEELMKFKGSGKYRNIADYKQRIDYCSLLKNTLLCQDVVRNRKFLGKENYRCSNATKKKNEKTIRRLDEIIEILVQFEKKKED